MMPIGQISPRLGDLFSEDMPTGEITPWSPPTRSSQRQQDVLSDVASISSDRSRGTASTCMVIAIAVKAHEKMRVEPFGYVFNHLIQPENCKVVVICCLSRVQSELGHSVMIDDDSFNGISKKKLAAAVNDQRKNLNHFLTAFQKGLTEKGVELDTHIVVGRKSEDILVQAAKTLHPLWVVLDSSWVTFSGNQLKTIQAALQECNVVLMRNSKPVILQLTTQPFVPVQQSHDQGNSEEFVDPVSRTSSPSSENSSSNPNPPTITTETPSLNRITPIIITETPSSNQVTSNIPTETSSSNPITPTITTETPSPNQITSTRPTETRSSNQITSTISTETPSSNQIISTIPTETPSSNQTIASNQSTATTTTETSSSNGTTQTITPETPCSNGTSPTMITPETPCSNGTTATRTTEASQTESETSARGPTLPSPPPSKVATKGRLKVFYDRITSTGPMFPNLTIPLNSPERSPDSLIKVCYNRLTSNLTMPLNSTDSGSGTSTPRRENQRSPITPSPSPSVASRDQSNQKCQLKPIQDTKFDSPSKSTVNRSNLPPANSNEDISYEIALEIAMEASIRSAIEEGVSVSPSDLNLSSRDKGGAGPSDRTHADIGQFKRGLVDRVQSNYYDRGGSSAGLGTSVAGIFPDNSGRPQPTPSPSPGLAGYWSPSAPPLPSDGPIQYPLVDASPVLETWRSTAGPSEGLPAKQKQKAKDRSSGECVICWSAPAEAVCVPCGHIAGCQNCLTKAKHWGCPLCRATIQQVIKVYAV